RVLERYARSAAALAGSRVASAITAMPVHDDEDGVVADPAAPAAGPAVLKSSSASDASTPVASPAGPAAPVASAAGQAAPVASAASQAAPVTSASAFPAQAVEGPAPATVLAAAAARRPAAEAPAGGIFSPLAADAAASPTTI